MGVVSVVRGLALPPVGADVGGVPGPSNATTGSSGRFRNTLTVTAHTLHRVRITLTNVAVADEHTLFVRTTADAILGQGVRASMVAGENEFTLASPVALAAGSYRFELVRTSGGSVDIQSTNSGVVDGVVTGASSDYFSAGAYVSNTPFVGLMRLIGVL